MVAVQAGAALRGQHGVVPLNVSRPPPDRSGLRCRAMSKDVGAVLASGRTNDIRTFKHPDVLGTSPQKRVRAEEEAE